MLLCKEKIKKILIINLKYLGDLVVCTPIYYSLNKYFPDAKVDIIIRSTYKSFFEFDKNINKVIEFDLLAYRKKRGIKRFISELKFILLLRKERYDLVLTLHPTDRLAIWAFFTGAKIRVGYADQSFGYLFNYRINIKEESINYLDYYLETLRVLGIKDINRDTYVCTDDYHRNLVNNFIEINNLKKSSFIIGIHPGASTEEKIWGIEKYNQLLNLLLEKNIPVFLFFGPNDELLVKSISNGINSNLFFTIDTSKSIPLLIAFIEKCNLIVCNDSFISHISAALNKKTLVIISRIKMHCWKIYDRPNYKYVFGDICKKCINNTCRGYDCLKNIPTESVYKNILNLIND